MKLLFCELTPRCLGLSLLFYLWAVSLVNGQDINNSTGACPNLTDTSTSTSEEDCCAPVRCPEGFYSTNINCSLNKTVVLEVPVSSNNATNSSNNGVTCSRCHEDCPDGTACTGPKPEDCTQCIGDVCSTTPVPTTTTTLPIPVIAGGAAGGGVFIIIIIVVICVLCRKRRKKDDKSPDPDHELGSVGHTDSDDNEVNGNNDGMRPKPSLREQISRGHDKVMRYTPDPTQIGPEKPPVVDNRQSELYENHHQVELMRGMSQDNDAGTGKKKPGKTGKKGKKDRVKDGPIYENFESLGSEKHEIAKLPVAPGVPKGLANQATESQDEFPESGGEVSRQVFPSLYSKQMLISKEPQYNPNETEPTTSSPSPALPTSKPSQNKWKIGAKKNQSKLISKPSAIMKGPAYNNESQAQDLVHGAAYDDEENSGATQAGVDSEGQVPGLKKGPMYQKGEPHYKNEHFGKTDGAAATTTGLMKGPAYRAGEKGEESLNRRVTKPKTGHVKNLIAGFGARKSPTAEDSDSGPEDYEPVNPPPDDAQPKYINLGFQS